MDCRNGVASLSRVFSSRAIGSPTYILHFVRGFSDDAGRLGATDGRSAVL
jgi:hypothetical protein